MSKRLLTLGLLAICAGFASCTKDDSSNNNGGTSGKATVKMNLTDAPGEYDNVYIDIQKVEVTMKGSSAVTLDLITPGVYDLLQFSNGMDTLLVNTTLPAGDIEQIRLILGSNNSVVVDGQSYPLTTPSGQTSGVKLNLHQTLVAGGAYEFWLDFDAGKSIHETGSGKYMLKPVIRAYSALTDGRIRGIVLPPSAFATVYATNGVDSFSAIPSTFNGAYLFTGLPAGTYQVTLDAGDVNFVDTTIANVQVQYGTEVNLGSILLHL